MSGARRLGRYVVGERLGSGGLGEVYLAHVEGTRGFRKRVVIKQARRELARRPEVAASLLAEADVVQGLAHGNIVQVLDAGLDDGAPYLVMEFVDGVSLAELLADLRRRGARLSPAAALFVGESVCAALAYAHAAHGAGERPLGLVHRDVTPANILVSREGVVKLTDFGIAATAGTATSAGTPGYAAPEQLAGGTVDGRADLYALGVVLGELFAVMRDGDDVLRAIAGRAVAVTPDERFADARELAAALEGWRAEQKIRSEPAELAEHVRALQERRSAVARKVGAVLGERRQTAMLASPARPRRTRWGAVAVAVLCGAAWSALPEEPVSSGESLAEVGPAGEVELPREELPSAPTRSREEPAPVPSSVAVAPASVEPSQTPVRERRREPAGVGRLHVNLVPWAQASVDGRDLGRTPISVELAPGKHTLVLANPDLGQRRTRQISIGRDADTHITDW